MYSLGETDKTDLRMVLMRQEEGDSRGPGAGEQEEEDSPGEEANDGKARQ